MTPDSLKFKLLYYRQATADYNNKSVHTALEELLSSDAQVRMCHPFGTLEGPADYLENCLAPLHVAMPDLERRDMILIAGTTAEGQDWVGTMGNYMGTFVAPFSGIPPTGHLAHMRYHEYFRFEEGRAVEMQAIWDLPELMMQANAWPMAPQLGAYLCTPAPMSGDGLAISGNGQKSHDTVIAMLTDLCRYPSNPDPAVMQLEKYWHPRFNWYGPAGIGTCRGISGFRNWHQIPFLAGMPDRKLDAMGDLMSHWIAEGNFVCETGWPNMRLTLSGDGWMGIASAGQEVFLRSLDFWRVEGCLIRENWVLVDLLDLYHQIGVNVIGRMMEFTKARNTNPISVPSGMAY